jgi:predicted ester cyclase
MSAEENKAVVRRYFEEVWNQGNLAVLDEIMAPECPINDDEHTTREQWRDALAAWLSALPDFHYHVHHLVAEGDLVAAKSRFTGTHRGHFRLGTWADWPPTGNSVDYQEMIFFHLADGKIVKVWDAWEGRAFAQQLGGGQPQATTKT